MSNQSRPLISARRGQICLIVGLIVLTGWMSLVPLDQGVIVPGALGFEGERKTITHPYGGVVEAIMVSEGQHVQAGQILVRLNDTETQTQWNAMSIQRQALEAKLERLTREMKTDENTSSISASTEAPQSKVLQKTANQKTSLDESVLYEERQRNLQNQIQTLKVEANTAQLNLTTLRESIQVKKAHLYQLARQEAAYKDMVEKGYMAVNRLLELQSQINSLKVALIQDDYQANQLNGQIQSSKLKIGTLISQLRTDIQTQITEVQIQLASLSQQLEKLGYQLTHAEVVSPVNGQVLGLQLFTPGSSIPANTPLMHITPQSAQLEVNAQLAPNLADQVRLDQQVTIRFSGLKTAKALEVLGTVSNLGADQLSDPTTRMSFIPVKVKLDSDALQSVARHRLQAGVPVELLITTGQHTMLQYLLRPISDHMFPALREQ